MSGKSRNTGDTRESGSEGRLGSQGESRETTESGETREPGERRNSEDTRAGTQETLVSSFLNEKMAPQLRYNKCYGRSVWKENGVTESKGSPLTSHDPKLKLQLRTVTNTQ